MNARGAESSLNAANRMNAGAMIFFLLPKSLRRSEGFMIAAFALTA